MDRSFQEARLIAQDLAESNPVLQIEVRSLAEADWLDYLTQKKRELGGKAFRHMSEEPMIIHSVIGYLGGVDELVAFGETTYKYSDPRKSPLYSNFDKEFADHSQNDFNTYMSRGSRRYCFFEFDVANNKYRLVFELFSDKCPKTCDNFIALCTGSSGKSYTSSPFHRIVRDAWIQGGDIVSGRGDGNVSSWGDVFADETFCVKHDAVGTLSMASSGPHTNGSQFFITMRPLPCFDGKRVAFGRVVSGFKGLTVLNELDTVNERPKHSVKIIGCGELKVVKKAAPKKKVAASDPTKKATLVVIGLDGAGKSTITNHLVGSPDPASTTPTLGFDLDRANIGDYRVTFYNLGGAKGIRGYWGNYFDEAAGVIYVLDAADAARFSEAVDAAKNALIDHRMVGKPVLFFLNKNDLKNPLSRAELALAIGIKDESNVRIFSSTAISADTDPVIEEGISWLLDQISFSYDELQVRIAKDVAVRKEAASAKYKGPKAEIV